MVSNNHRGLADTHQVAASVLMRQPVETDVERLQARVRELEVLCAEVYVAAVELGLPQDLLNRLWSVVSVGEMPHAFQLDDPGLLPPKPAPAPQAGDPAPPVAPTSLPKADPVQQWMESQGVFPARREAAAPRPAEHQLQPLPGRRTVLVVDDDVMMLEVLVRILSRENYELLTAGSGPDALALLDARGGSLDLLVTDFSMPEMRGRELADRVRARHPAIKVLYQTGFSDLLFEDRAELEEGSAFLEKPFTARGLREAARLVLFGALNP
jgi:CheY-like chemotaxis protein